MKRAFQMCLMVFVLLMQTAPLIVMAAPSEEKCQMACCLGLGQAGMADCSCTEPSFPDNSPSTPLPPASAGRDFIPQVVWTEMQTKIPAFSFPEKQTGRTIRPDAEESARPRLHVRLSVLLCSLLT